MKIAVIGAGNMARAIIGSVKKGGRISPDTFCAYDTSENQLVEIAKLGVKTEINLKNAIIDSDFVLIAVKPQDICAVIDQIKNQCDNFSDKKYISICAGISTDYICGSFGCDVPVIRVMPNTPMLIGAGATAITRNKLVNDKDYSKICGIFAFGGEVTSIPESQMNAIISLNSSSPAYFYEIIRIMIEYAKNEGIDEKSARIMAQNAMYGAAKMLMAFDESPDELISMVKSKKGTTEAALDSFKQNGLEKIMFDAMSACTKRAFELGK